MSHRKERRETGLFLCEGLRIVGEAVNSNWKVEQIIYAPELLNTGFGTEIVDLAKSKRIELIEVAKSVFESIARKDNPQGIAAIIHQQTIDAEAIADEGGSWIALFEAADPGNVGTILRTSDAAGFNGVILVGDCTDPFDPTSVRASMGAIFSQKVSLLSLDEIKKLGELRAFSIIGTSDKAALDYTQVDYSNNLILFMGSERQGLSGQAIELCDKVVSIPMAGKSDSLNLSIASGIMMFEVFNLRRKLRIDIKD